MSLATLIEIKLVGTFALFLGLLVWQLVSVRRAMKSDRDRDGEPQRSRTDTEHEPGAVPTPSAACGRAAWPARPAS